MNSTSESIDLTHFDVRTMPCRVKHKQIFQRWSDLSVGQHFVLINDHDPLPLYYQFEAQFPEAFRWEYLVSGPDEYRVRITRLAASEPPALGSQTTSPVIDPRAVLDVRPIPPRFKHTRIFERWLSLPVGGYFVLLNDHDPMPLRYQFQAQFPNAFSWEYLETGPDDFRVKIGKLADVAVSGNEVRPPAGAAPKITTTASGNLQQIDVRGLEPPEPLIRILDALESLPAGYRLRAITDRQPCHLFGEAEQRGFRHDATEQPDGSWITLLERA